jgi:hypothetical protein
MTVIPVLWRWKQEVCGFQASLGYIGKSCLKKIKRTTKNKYFASRKM